MIQIVPVGFECVRTKFTVIRTMRKKPFDSRIEFVELIHMSMKVIQLERVSARQGMDRCWLNFPIHTDTDGNER